MTRYIKLAGGYQPQEITIEELIEEYPDVDFCDSYYQNLSDEKLAKYNVYELHTSPKPTIPGEFVEGPPLKMESGLWIQNWVRKTSAPWQ